MIFSNKKRHHRAYFVLRVALVLAFNQALVNAQVAMAQESFLNGSSASSSAASDGSAASTIFGSAAGTGFDAGLGSALGAAGSSNGFAAGNLNGGFTGALDGSGGANITPPGNLQTGFPGGFVPTSMLDSPAVNQTQPAQNVQSGAPINNSPAYQQQSPPPPDVSTGFSGQAGFGSPGGAAQNVDNTVVAQPVPPKKVLEKNSDDMFAPQTKTPKYGDLMKAADADVSAFSATKSGPSSTGATNRNGYSDSSSSRIRLVPPPTPYPISAQTGTSGLMPGNANPLAKAIDQLKLGHVTESIKSIDQVLHTNQQNAHAHYLKAVALVLDRNFGEARAEYNAAIKYSHSEELTGRARIGLNKLAR